MVTIHHLLFYCVQDFIQVLKISDGIRMFRPKYLLTDAQCPLTKGMRLSIATLRKGEFGQVVEPFGGCGMLRSKCFLKDSERPLPKRLGLLIVSLFIREPCQQI